MKLLLIKLPPLVFTPLGENSELLTINKWYEGKLSPLDKWYEGEYGTQTLEPKLKRYIVKCDDGELRKIEGEYFITQEECRERKLNEIGI